MFVIKECQPYVVGEQSKQREDLLANVIVCSKTVSGGFDISSREIILPGRLKHNLLKKDFLPAFGRYSGMKVSNVTGFSYHDIEILSTKDPRIAKQFVSARGSSLLKQLLQK
jgi:hypothetical protein